MPAFDTATLVLLAGAVAAGFVQGLSGFAFSMTATSIWIWWLPPQLVAVMAVFGALAGQLIAAVTTRRPAVWPRLWPLLAGGLCGLPMGLWLLPRLDADLFRLGVGLLLAVWCPLMLLSKHLPQVRRGGRLADAAAGLGGGLVGALGGFTGVLPTLWATLRGWPKDDTRAVIQNFNLAMLSITFASYVLQGLVHRSHMPQLLLVAAAVLVPVLLGARLYSGVSPDAFRRLVLALLACSGVALLARAVPALLVR